jgi:hypothetical protein
MAIYKKMDKAQAALEEVKSYVLENTKLKLEEGPSHMLSSRWWYCIQEKNAEEAEGTKRYSIGYMVDLMLGDTFIFDFKVMMRDTSGIYTSIAVDMSNKNWRKQADDIYCGLKYLCEQQNRGLRQIAKEAAKAE